MQWTQRLGKGGVGLWGGGLNLCERTQSKAEGIEGPETNGTALITLLIIEANYSIINSGAAMRGATSAKCAKSTTTNDSSCEE